ncbi:MAG: FMN-binding protein [Gordonia sp. (in: high G+C Gram-positive bacteria)]|uniref:FMN-binding protein n=1 Tax=Gordonia sp. (in: high G+C Gram-positive bacteria) TaxID=84139 RepID=UPI0039E54BB6
MTVHLRKTFAVAAAATSLFLFTACSSDDGGNGTTTTAAESPAAQTSTTDTAAAGAYKAGTYTAEDGYITPGGRSEVKVELTIDDKGTISAVTVTPEATNSNSIIFQTKFAGGIADEIVGKSIDELNVTKVSGSSLTSNGFNKAVETIKGEAKA